MTSLAERAHAAAVFITHTAAVSPYGPYRGADQARTAIRLSAALGLGLTHITTTSDRLRRRTAPGEPVLATATCPDTQGTYTFLARNPLYDDEPFELLGPCPACNNPVPLAEVRHLGDLGTHLAHTPYRPEDLLHADRLPDTFWLDSGHTDTCRYGETL
ncbi:hypothetical protein OG897_36580 [Streptomyces sp. NBC_00237]|uniref:hypothetical protein n=1 Tax=Streptomyces sp. NBC_00237 TaxID=2975687 RepID=UPI00225BDB39|nr:hypothetical protein [Streptomyces sp. NBC_00237]MCX5206905.1 hypothetical protein [Streptomyces sp. NBC_00237]